MTTETERYLTLLELKRQAYPTLEVAIQANPFPPISAPEDVTFKAVFVQVNGDVQPYRLTKYRAPKLKPDQEAPALDPNSTEFKYGVTVFEDQIIQAYSFTEAYRKAIEAEGKLVLDSFTPKGVATFGFKLQYHVA